jgi:hypothetical protein
LEFPDKKGRNQVESVLREYCGITGLIPYPGILRACIKSTVDHFKSVYPDNFIKVSVDHVNLHLKVNYRIKDGLNKPIWKSGGGAIPLPDIVLDTSARLPPVGTNLFALLKLDNVSPPVDSVDLMDSQPSLIHLPSQTTQDTDRPISQSIVANKDD